jgi:hemoglobin-like flavoprotein
MPGSAGADFDDAHGDRHVSTTPPTIPATYVLPGRGQLPPRELSNTKGGTMTPKRIQLVQKTWKLAQPNAAQVAELFYGRLFHLEPSYRPLFKGNTKEQGKKLTQMINVAVNGLPKLDTIVPAVEDLCRRHLDYNVTEEMYDTVGESLLWTLEQGLGEAFTDDVRDAWAETYAKLAEVMKAAAYEPVAG